MLFMLGQTVSQLPPQLLQAIESVAMNCATQMQDPENVDFAGLSQMLMGGLGSVLGGGGAGALGGLGSLGSAGRSKPSSRRLT